MSINPFLRFYFLNLAVFVNFVANEQTVSVDFKLLQVARFPRGGRWASSVQAPVGSHLSRCSRRSLAPYALFNFFFNRVFSKNESKNNNLLETSLKFRRMYEKMVVI